MPCDGRLFDVSIMLSRFIYAVIAITPTELFSLPFVIFPVARIDQPLHSGDIVL
jgi:hypothetical protein